MSEFEESETETSSVTEGERRLQIGSQVYLFLWRVFLAIGVVAFIVLFAEWLAASGLLSVSYSQAIAAVVDSVRAAFAYIWPALMVALPATYLLMARKEIGFLWPAWALVWVPLSFVFGHAALVEAFFDSGILGEDSSPPHRWDIFLLSTEYMPYAVNVALKGAALDLMESFRISIAEPSPSENLPILQSIEFVFRTLYSGWGALVLFRLYYFLKGGRVSSDQ